MPGGSNNLEPQQRLELVHAFRLQYQRFQQAISEAILRSHDSTVLARLGDDLTEYLCALTENSFIFDSAELIQIRTNVCAMQTDVRLQYEQMLDQSHHGRPVIIQESHLEGRGRPALNIDPGFLAWAYTQRSTSEIARFLNISRRTVRNRLLEYGIVEPQQQPAALQQSADLSEAEHVMITTNLATPDDILDPHYQIPDTSRLIASEPRISSYTGLQSALSETELDSLLLHLRSQFRRAGITMLDGMLRRLGVRISRERIRESLRRIDPVQRVFQRIRIRRREYSVPGPNALWHHDGQHGLIRWGIVIHGFIDGYSRLVTALKASNNNTGQTVLNLFLLGASLYGVPSRLRGDHGVENLLVAAWMTEHRGEHRGSYIWGRSVHNIRIERLWVDVTAQVGATWADHFTRLELHYGLNINNTHHIWLLHCLFLNTINEQLAFFAESWNQHRMQIRNGRNRSPADMFTFDMFVNGIRGDQLPLEDEMDTEELEVYGVDWEGLRDDRILQSQVQNNSAHEGSSSWIGQTGPPEHLNEVPLESPEGPFSADELLTFEHEVQQYYSSVSSDHDVDNLWLLGLNTARFLRIDIF